MRIFIIILTALIAFGNFVKLIQNNISSDMNRPSSMEQSSENSIHRQITEDGYILVINEGKVETSNPFYLPLPECPGSEANVEELKITAFSAPIQRNDEDFFYCVHK